ncbi:Aspartic proteinase CDR1 [Linum perenne]
MSPYSPLQFFLFIISTLIFSTSHGLNITIPLIHRDSIYSPLYNATETIEDRAQRVAKASLDRYEHLSQALSIRPEANLVPGFRNLAFYMNLSIGTPLVPQLLLIDTGSSLFWVKCKPCTPCKHGPKDPPIFDPDNSSSNYELPCQKNCKKCTKGIYVKDRITFETSIDGSTNITLRNFLFGCSNYLTDTGTDIEKHFSGIIGLGPANPGRYLGGVPLVWELGSEFSYCIGRLSDRSYPYNSISFGRNAKMIGMETPMYTNDVHYYVKLLHMSIGGGIFYIDPEVFKGMSNKNGIMVDSGAEVSVLPNEALDVVKEEVKREARLRGMKQVWTTFRLRPFSLCYRGTVDKDAHGFAPLGFHFEQGGSYDDPEPVLTVQSFGLFYQVKKDIFCLAIIGSKNNLGILGMSAQQQHNFGFDINHKRIYFDYMDCGLLNVPPKIIV